MATNPAPSAKQIFQDAVELSGPERTAFLERACAGTPDLRARVDALLRAHESSEDPDLGALTFVAVDLEAGARVGPYRLVERLGEGGFGVVWRALQEEPVKREVALKILKLGMDTQQVVRRFEVERQALALMDHPSIARVFDAGSTDQGRPYFVMELVRGVSITEYCKRERLGLEARLQLFLLVCQAVQHAHQKGVVHRDLKPSNILVAVQDGEAVPKIIDFGIAKASRSELAVHTLVTAHDQFIGSPEYMSPEQTIAGSQDIDTRADVYSLGVVLYELLTGALPFDLRDAGTEGYQGVFRRIRELDPPRPSTRLGQLREDAAALPLPGAKLQRLFRRDLDWIVMKALEKERSRRYETVSAFAADIARFLRHEPVEASPPSVLYRVRKTARRHRITVMTLAAVSLALAIGVALALAGFLEAREQARLAIRRGDEARDQALLASEARAEALDEKARAEQQRDRANAVVGLLQEMLGAAGEDRSLGPDYSVRELLDRFGANLGDELAQQPLVEATIRTTMGTTYIVLDLPQKARPHIVRARELRHEHLGPDHPDTLSSDIDYARLLTLEGRFDEAQELFLEKVPRYLQAEGVPPRAKSVARSMVAAALSAGGKYAEAEEWLRDALAGVEAGDVEGRAVLTNNMGLLAEERADFAEAERLYERALELHEEGGNQVEQAKTLCNLGNVLMAMQRYDEAEDRLRRGLEIFDRLTGEDSFLAYRARHNLARVLTETGRFDEAEPLLLGALEYSRRALRPGHPDVAHILSSLSLLYSDRGEDERAVELALEALDLRRAALGDDHPDLASSEYNVGVMLLEEGRLEEAEQHLRRSLAIVRSFEGGVPYRPRVLFELSTVREELGDPEDALDLAVQAYTTAIGVLSAVEVATARSRVLELAGELDDELVAAGYLLDAGLTGEAEPRVRRALEVATGRDLALARILMGRLLTESGEVYEAEELLLDTFDELSDEPEDLALRRAAGLAILGLYESWERPEDREAWHRRLVEAGLVEP